METRQGEPSNHRSFYFRLVQKTSELLFSYQTLVFKRSFDGFTVAVNRDKILLSALTERKMGTCPRYNINWFTQNQNANLLEDHSMNIDLAVVARDLLLPPEKIEGSVQLLDDGNAIPSINLSLIDI